MLKSGSGFSEGSGSGFWFIKALLIKDIDKKQHRFFTFTKHRLTRKGCFAASEWWECLLFLSFIVKMRCSDP